MTLEGKMDREEVREEVHDILTSTLKEEDCNCDDYEATMSKLTDQIVEFLFKDDKQV